MKMDPNLVKKIDKALTLLKYMSDEDIENLLKEHKVVAELKGEQFCESHDFSYMVSDSDILESRIKQLESDIKSLTQYLKSQEAQANSHQYELHNVASRHGVY